MNQRIRELHTKATTWALDNYPPPVNTFMWEDLRNEKFAELIVQECVYVIQEELDSGQYSQPVHTGFRVSKNLIKEHFGVEE